MKITVVADDAGKIIGFSHETPGSSGPVTHATALAAGEGQSLHSVELPPELVQRIGDDAFAGELLRHTVVKKGRAVSLAKPAAKAKAATKTKRR